ncbi:DNA internalization-related competence protein ComEC/Rec2 [Fredinandcohnia sp. 179-A 10B2 NHS]|uniref:DNA internalization-related competence protein ComEC/Rec2 n=1 Tax=Fredinandcohnia sp. 179-A 10B2 NHS TaxID=3235176 RepID=UPI00399EF336
MSPGQKKRKFRNYMNRLQHYFQLLWSRLLMYWDYVQGKLFYIALFALFGIIVPYTLFHWISLLFPLSFLIYIILRHHFIFVVTCLCVFFFFMTLFVITDNNNISTLSYDKETLNGKVIDSPDINGDKLTATIKIPSNEKVLLTYIIKTEEEKNKLSTHFQVGISCSFMGTLERPEVSRNPNAFDYKKYLYLKEIHWLYEIKEIDLGNCNTVEKFDIMKTLLKVRKKGVQQIETYFDGTSAGMVQALIYGERRNISTDIVSSYQSLGLIHLLAISGLHVGLMTGMFFFLLIRLGITREFAATILLCFLPIYMIIAGGSPSVIRSVLMTMIVLISLLWFKKVSILDVISIAFIIMLAVNPYLVVNIGFQLSFIVSFSLVLSSGVIFRKYNHFLSSLFAVSFVSQISSMPILLYHFYEFSLLSLPLNMLYVPLYSVIILPMALLTVFLLGVIEPLGLILTSILTFILNVSNHVTLFFSGFSFSVLTLGKPSFVLMVLYVLSIFYYVKEWEKHKRWLQKAIIGPILLIGIQFLLPFVNPTGEVTMLDVGQGDSIVVELPYRKAVYLIDTGGTVEFEKEDWRKRRTEFSTGEDIILPYLASRGIRSLSRVIITHGDQDHIGGAEDVLRSISVDMLVLATNKSKNSQQEENLLKLAAEKNISIEMVEIGKMWSEGDYSFYVLGPNGSERQENDNSIILYSELGGLKWLFMGDTEKSGEQSFISTYKNIEVDVLKVGHHGSKTSSTEFFIKKVNPEVALIPVGKNNRFNHPHPEVVKRLNSSNIHVYRTDLNGAVSYRFSKKKGTFRTIIP